MKSVLAAAVIGGLLAAAPGGSARAQEPPQRSVFVVAVMEHAFQGPHQYTYHGMARGTGFFVTSDGTALTSSHLVYPVRTNPVTYQLLAVVGREFYGATLVCASDLPYDPVKQSTSVPVGRDIAKIRLTPSSFPFDQLEYGGTQYAVAHQGPLPAFPALTLAAGPSVGDDVRVLGFGYLSEAPIPYEWSATGTVSRTGELRDGTQVFEVTMTREAEPGHSGSPVLNLKDQVAGLWNWGSVREPKRWMAISSPALDPACP